MTAPEMMDDILARETKSETRLTRGLERRRAARGRDRSRRRHRDVARACGSRPSRLRACQQVGPEVLDVLDADREPQQGVGDVAGSAPSAGGVPGSTRRRRASGVHPEPGRCGDSVGRVRAAGRDDADHRAEAGVAHLGRRPGGRRGGGPARRRSPGRAPCARAGCAGRAAPARPPACPGSAPSRSRRPLSTSQSASSRGDDRAHQQVAVAAEVLRRRVHDDVGAERERLLAGSGWRRCCRRPPSRRPRARPRRWSRCRRSAATGWSATPATPGRRRRPGGDEAGGVLDVDQPGPDPTTRLEVGQLQHRAVVGDARRDHGRAVARPDRAPSRPRRARRRTPVPGRPPGRPSAASKACQVGLPVRPYSRSPPAMYVDAIVIGMLSGWSESCGGRPPCTTRVAGLSGSAMPVQP